MELTVKRQILINEIDAALAALAATKIPIGALAINRSRTIKVLHEQRDLQEKLREQFVEKDEAGNVKTKDLGNGMQKLLFHDAAAEKEFSQTLKDWLDEEVTIDLKELKFSAIEEYSKSGNYKVDMNDVAVLLQHGIATE